MYNRFAEEMEYAKVGEKILEPVWMDRDGNPVDGESKSFGCGVSHKIVRPDIMFCLDKVGSNTSQKGDGAVGG